MSSVRKIQNDIANSSDVDLADYASSDYKKVDFSGIENTLETLAAQYIEKISNNIDARDVVSSGHLQDNITPTDVSENNGVFSVGIMAPDYMSYQDEGVNGWRCKEIQDSNFARVALHPSGDMVTALKGWVKRQGLSARNVKKPVTSRERKGMQLKDATTNTAIAMAYKIKRDGLKARKFFTDATNEMEDIIADQLGESVSIEIVKNILP